jgi:ABC-type transport system involved in multi-copper enzyme maturation permease subunit
MMRVLIAKELRGLRPVAICIVGFIVFGNLFMLASEMPDKQLLDPAKWSGNSGPMVMVLAIFGMMIGSGVLIKESDQGTLGFIDGLPLSRTRFFIAKVIAAFAVGALGILIDFPFTLFFD